MPSFEQQIDVATVASRKLIENPRGHSRLARLRKRRGVFGAAGRAELFHEPRALAHEIVEARAV